MMWEVFVEEEVMRNFKNDDVNFLFFFGEIVIEMSFLLGYKFILWYVIRLILS